MSVRLIASLMGALVTAVPLAACSQDVEPSGNRPAASTAESAPPAAPVVHAAPPLTGSFEAISTTAMGISGDLTLTERSLTFTLGLTYETENLAPVPAAQDYGKSADSWADLLGVPAESTVELRRVTRETVAAKAPNRGFCSPDAVTFLALATASRPSHRPSLKLAAFKGDSAPGPAASATNLCGTFNYGPKP